MTEKEIRDLWPLRLDRRRGYAYSWPMTSTTTYDFPADTIVPVVGSGLRGARRRAAISHNARIRSASRPRYNGRFVRMVDVRAIQYGDTPEVFTDTDHMGYSHAYAGCPARTTAAYVVEPFTHHGWLCGACISTPVSVLSASRDVAPVGFTMECRTCHTVRKATAFPTVVDSGYRLRGDECRKCESTHRTPRKSSPVPIATEVAA